MNISIPWLKIEPVPVDVLAQAKHTKNVDFSIIIASYNRISHLPHLLESIFAQQGDYNYEVVIVDDASPAAQLSELLSHPLAEKLTLIRLQKNSGSEALPQNVGVYFAQGEILFFIDSDDYLCHPDATSVMYEALQNNDQAVFAFSNIIFQIEIENLPENVAWIRQENDFYPTPMHQMRFTERTNGYKIRAAQEYSFFDLMVYAYAIGLRAFKKQALVRVGGWTLELKSHDDYGLLLALAAAGYKNNKQYLLPVDIDAYAYRITGEQASTAHDHDEYSTQRAFLMKVLHENHISYAQLEQASDVQKTFGKVAVLERWNIRKEELHI